jgi:hypothetical protein
MLNKYKRAAVCLEIAQSNEFPQLLFLRPALQARRRYRAAALHMVKRTPKLTSAITPVILVLALGFAAGVTDSKIIKLFVDDEPFWLPDAHLLTYDRRLNMRSGTLDREILWETSAGKEVSIKSRRLVSFPSRHVAAV